MTYSKEEREKIHSNLDKIKEYLDGIKSQLRHEVTVDFGEIKQYADFSREKEFHISVSAKSISCRIGGLGFDFSKPDPSHYSATAYSELEFAVALIREWFTVKSTVNNAIKEQERMFADIYNFEI